VTDLISKGNLNNIIASIIFTGINTDEQGFQELFHLDKGKIQRNSLGNRKKFEKSIFPLNRRETWTLREP